MSSEELTNDEQSPDIGQLMQMRAMYELTTNIASKCFDSCLSRLNPRLDDADKNCISNCAANFLHMKLFFTKRIIDAAQSVQLAE
jgi:hypothetical protein